MSDLTSTKKYLTNVLSLSNLDFVQINDNNSNNCNYNILSDNKYLNEELINNLLSIEYKIYMIKDNHPKDFSRYIKVFDKDYYSKKIYNSLYFVLSLNLISLNNYKIKTLLMKKYKKNVANNIHYFWTDRLTNIFMKFYSNEFFRYISTIIIILEKLFNENINQKTKKINIFSSLKKRLIINMMIRIFIKNLSKINNKKKFKNLNYYNTIFYKNFNLRVNNKTKKRLNIHEENFFIYISIRYFKIFEYKKIKKMLLPLEILIKNKLRTINYDIYNFLSLKGHFKIKCHKVLMITLNKNYIKKISLYYKKKLTHTNYQIFTNKFYTIKKRIIKEKYKKINIINSKNNISIISNRFCIFQIFFLWQYFNFELSSMINYFYSIICNVYKNALIINKNYYINKKIFILKYIFKNKKPKISSSIMEKDHMFQFLYYYYLNDKSWFYDKQLIMLDIIKYRNSNRGKKFITFLNLCIN
ncbi:hypothetical protein (nucleomorph) [Guillardia theta]|uniref:Uncharacterized protein n=1 Tax=Guillardia theta TaxID=55529 RepID=Q9SEA5_GUITH|nr:hypothetical protein GTHECHR1004 [Guillardia theta]AAF24211.1 hypothetical protein [Guillardia theta]